MPKPLLYTTRNEVDGPLEIFSGSLPADVNGVFYVCYPVGTVNSGGLPFPEKLPDGKDNPEYASPIMNGDGMTVKIDFTGTGAPTIRSRILKSPCFYADLNTRYGTEGHEILGFKNFGISRMSLALGARNELNTALIPVQFDPAKNTFLLATYDVGRPFITDADSLELKTPVGWNNEWIPGTPSFVPWPFSLVQSTAHPTFDPVRRELYSVNFTRSTKSLLFEQRLQHFLKNEPEVFEQKLEDLARKWADHPDLEKLVDRVDHFFSHLHEELDRPDPLEGKPPAEDQPGEVYLIRWNGGPALEKWLLQDQDGNPVQIEECMHQTGISADYFIITECAFKFSVDLLVNNPFPHNPVIDRLMRRYLARPMVPHTNTYIVRRRELVAGGGQATAYKTSTPIPVETIHYSCNFDNPDGKITLYAIHNSAVCIAEWVRPYDIDKLTGQPTDPELRSLFAVGSMDVSRFGKWVIDAENGVLLENESTVYAEEGNWQGDDVGPNTWGLGLYAYRDMISGTVPVGEIRYLWYTSDGVDTRMLTEFIYDLYQDYPNRIVSLDDMLKVTQRGVPFSLVQLNTATMKGDDYYQAPKYTFLRSVEFMPRPTPTPGVDPQLDGYLMVVVQAGYEQPDQTWTYGSEFWIFDAGNIHQGPLCKMRYPDLHFAFTLHTTWLPKAGPYDGDYSIDIRKDYNEVISKLPDALILQPFFDAFVYPYFGGSPVVPPPAPAIDPKQEEEGGFLADLFRWLRDLIDKLKQWFS